MGDLIQNRREFFKGGAAGVGAAFLFAACGNLPADTNTASNTAHDNDEKKEPEVIEVTAVEDLMREHGILRRALLVYAEAAMRLRKNADVSPAALQRTAKLFRAFGEEYHEKKLEEAFIFPRIRELGSGDAAKYPDILTAQHDRGRQITDYIISVTATAKVSAEASGFADSLEAFVRMYQHHAAREDTIVFPAWKGLLSSGEYGDLNDKFEEIEQEQFGEDGFEDAAKQIGEIEASLGIDDISKFSSPPPK